MWSLGTRRFVNNKFCMYFNQNCFTGIIILSLFICLDIAQPSAVLYDIIEEFTAAKKKLLDANSVADQPIDISGKPKHRRLM